MWEEGEGKMQSLLVCKQVKQRRGWEVESKATIWHGSERRVQCSH